jgi:hypothetical protein
MKNWTEKRDRYLFEPLPNRLGELAANLARIQSFSKHDLNQDAVAYLIEESKFFIEWTAIDAGTDRAAELVELQVQLARWQLNWVKIWGDRVQRDKVAEVAKGWSNRILEMSRFSPEAIILFEQN